ncbi:trimethylguanosine synthase-like isoform X2 [Camellia sinensis]|uniref:trimethylguanosine synthase-like isoform X2 n=1 Tax=Camellia sinensis TaxID=4442 RepID=UPI001035BF3C|nr:trimethylguanosine synthase-like isoform X2 [Camellia sinensis]
MPFNSLKSLHNKFYKTVYEARVFKKWYRTSTGYLPGAGTRTRYAEYMPGMENIFGYVVGMARCYHVVAIDIDPQKVELAFNNAKIYGVEDYIDFIVGDFFQLSRTLKGDVAFLSPPWGGPSYKTIGNFTLDLLKPKDGYSLFQIAQAITPNIVMFLPRHVDLHQVEELSWLSSPPLCVEIEESYVKSNLKGITVYFGGAAFGQLGLDY